MEVGKSPSGALGGDESTFKYVRKRENRESSWSLVEIVVIFFMRKEDSQEIKEEKLAEAQVEHIPVIATPDQLRNLGKETAIKMNQDAEKAAEAESALLVRLDAMDIPPEVRAEMVRRYQRENVTILAEGKAAVEGEVGKEEPAHVSLWGKAREWLKENKGRRDELKARAASGAITAEYNASSGMKDKKGKEGVGSINGKVEMAKKDRGACIDGYVARLEKTGRKIPSREELEEALDEGLKTEIPLVGRQNVLFHEMTQELAYADFRRKQELEVSLGGEGIAADMMVELGLEGKEDLGVESLEQAREEVRKELAEYLKKGFINEREAELIQSTVEKFGNAYAGAFEGKKFPGGEIMTKETVIQHAYEGMRDNARKIAFQTKLDKRVFSGSDHGTRHICEGCTHFSETMMASMNGLEGVDFKPQDEVLIRQVIIDHDIGYTADAAQAKGGFEASKDHPCAGCAFVEAHQDYYEEKYGEEGFNIIRDVVLNHSYVQTEYQGTRTEVPADEITFNRDLIRSIVSTVDAMGVTSETKAMDMFRQPEAIDLLLDVKLYMETHGGKMEPAALAVAKKKFNVLIDKWVNEKTVSEERAKGYRSAIENQFNTVTAEITLGQFTGVVSDMKLERRKDGKIVPKIEMNVSRLAAIVGDNFGDKGALKGFAKALEDFGLSASLLQKQAGTVRELKGERDPIRREALLEKLAFSSDRATFQVDQREKTGLSDEREEEGEAIIKKFEAFEAGTIRSEIRRTFESLLSKKPEERTQGTVLSIMGGVRSLLDLDGEEMEKFESLQQRMMDGLGSDDKLKEIQGEIVKFKSMEEKTRLQEYEEAVTTDKLKTAI